MQVDDCSTCKYKTYLVDCSRRTWGDDGYLHFPEDGCYESNGESNSVTEQVSLFE